MSLCCIVDGKKVVSFEKMGFNLGGVMEAWKTSSTYFKAEFTGIWSVFDFIFRGFNCKYSLFSSLIAV